MYLPNYPSEIYTRASAQNIPTQSWLRRFPTKLSLATELGTFKDLPFQRGRGPAIDFLLKGEILPPQKN